MFFIHGNTYRFFFAGNGVTFEKVSSTRGIFFGFAHKFRGGQGFGR